MYILSSLLCALVASPPEACKALRGFYDAIGAKDKSPSFKDTSSTCCALTLAAGRSPALAASAFPSPQVVVPKMTELDSAAVGP